LTINSASVLKKLLVSVSSESAIIIAVFEHEIHT
jgi:hypothetical protein